MRPSSNSSRPAPRRSIPPWPAWGRTCCRRPSMPTRRSVGCATRPERRCPIAAGAARPAGAGRDRQRLQERGPVDRARVAVHRHRRRRRRGPRAARRDRPAPPARERRDGRTARNGPRRPATAAAPGPLYVYGRAGRPCRRCRTPIARARQGLDLPRLTFWCPACQPRPAYHRARCVSSSSPGPASRSASTSCGRSPRSWSGSDSAGSAGARPGRTAPGASVATATSARSATIPAVMPWARPRRRQRWSTCAGRRSCRR